MKASDNPASFLVQACDPENCIKWHTVAAFTNLTDAEEFISGDHDHRRLHPAPSCSNQCCDWNDEGGDCSQCWMGAA